MTFLQMRLFSTILLLFIISTSQSYSQKVERISKEVKRIAFLGNSITYNGQYICYVETYYRLKHPDAQLEWINVGLPSETVSGLSEENHADGAFPRPDLHERLARVFEKLQPDLVFVNYGMNDGIYLPFDEARFQKFREGMIWLSDKVDTLGIDAIYLTPPIYDPVKGPAYSNVLDIYSDWLVSKRYTDQWEVVDLHWPMRKFLENQREVDEAYFLAKDGVHPNATGHWLMAREILSFLGEKVEKYDDFDNAITEFPHGKEVYELVCERMELLRDAWLTEAGHLRPGLREGIPLREAEREADAIERKILSLLN